MAKKTYSWSNFSVVDPETRKVTKRIKPGDEITAKDLKVTDEEFEQYLESGAVREYPHPEVPENWQGSPTEYARAQLAAAARGDFFDTQYGRVSPGTDEAPEIDPETGKPLATDNK